MNDNARGFCVSCGVARNPGNTCDYCGRHYIDPIDTSQKTNDTPQKTKRAAALSAKYKITNSQRNTAITWRWGRRSGGILILFSMIWIGMTLPLATEFLEGPKDELPLQLLPMAVGIFLLCNGLMNLINKTSIFASKQSLYIQHHPIPWRGKFKIATSNVEQVFVSRIQRSSKETSWHAPALQLISKDGQRHQLLRGKREVEFSDFESLRLIILKALNIAPENVPGAHDSFTSDRIDHFDQMDGE